MKTERYVEVKACMAKKKKQDVNRYAGQKEKEKKSWQGQAIEG